MKFKDVCHLYIGCKAWKNNRSAPDKLVGLINGKLHGPAYLILEDGEEVSYDEVLPILTRPWELPTEVLEEVIKVDFPAVTGIKLSLPVLHHTLHFCYQYGGTIKENYISLSSLHPKQFTILLSNGADLFGLIDSGEAIDSKTLTQQTP